MQRTVVRVLPPLLSVYSPAIVVGIGRRYYVPLLSVLGLLLSKDLGRVWVKGMKKWWAGNWRLNA
ncbi:hypothetical protein KY290_015317 [Solanum tuberosum]|uniref:Uncharacterized protein n=1 Tax=Solanum tuberosum TaxID=4113 RepID=A0ABQ7VS66_SOLTU|nr:hypothetical protein KY289_014931 [Solanum tuberosum]KAH0771336.1 hypothetical protein KY290_015317 [Solanum tuberosum]